MGGLCTETMFEGRSKEKTLPDQRGSADLRQFRWTDLVAKLAASREHREDSGKIDAGYNAFAEVRREGSSEGKLAINHADLSDGKFTGLSLENAAGKAAQGDREKE